MICSHPAGSRRTCRCDYGAPAWPRGCSTRSECSRGAASAPLSLLAHTAAAAAAAPAAAPAGCGPAARRQAADTALPPPLPLHSPHQAWGLHIEASAVPRHWGCAQPWRGRSWPTAVAAIRSWRRRERRRPGRSVVPRAWMLLAAARSPGRPAVDDVRAGRRCSAPWSEEQEGARPALRAGRVLHPQERCAMAAAALINRSKDDRGRGRALALTSRGRRSWPAPLGRTLKRPSL